MLFNLDFDLMINISALIIIGGLSAYTFYVICPGAASYLFRPSIDTVPTQTTVVEVSEEELNQLLEVVYKEIGATLEISSVLLESLGLYTSTVVSHLEALGYIIT
jgi:hypothetical protein